MSDQKAQDTMPPALPRHPMPGIFPVPPGRLPVIPPGPRRKMVELTIDGRKVSVLQGTTLLEATRQLEIETPTLCFLETLTPVNACRICVVEVEGSRTLVPACSRKVEPGMVVRTDTERVRHSRRLVLEFLSSTIDVSTAPQIQAYMAQYGARAGRFGPPAAPRADRGAALPGGRTPIDGSHAANVAQGVKIDNELYVRDYGKCMLCYKCVQACGTQAQNTFAIAVASRGFEARVSTEYAVPLPESACVYCGNCIGVCPTGALLFASEYEMRQAGTWDESKQTQTDTICPYCGVGCTLRLHVQGNRIVKATSPLERDITRGNLCIKGRFGWQFVHGSDRLEAYD
jgi:predicted molibdopterin-dependent oxidoreductase YjgC